MSIYRHNTQTELDHIGHLSDEIVAEYKKVAFLSETFQYRGMKYTLDPRMSEFNLRFFTSDRSSLDEPPHLQYGIGDPFGEDDKDRYDQLKKVREFAKQYIEAKKIDNPEDRAKVLDMMTRKAKIPPDTIHLHLGLTHTGIEITKATITPLWRL